ncbi:hypothetical protein [Yersinia kristensenii]|uniref:Uncharacterized protein n=1 Tax=Yersinia kristensenii TaxID=28152 RepID=A0A0T9KYQ7_YERKR|nr:hypothetical protein [Yersinia kristensenii]CNE41579.1 Uncharacterised protein [Yersinia kristensenii]
MKARKAGHPTELREAKQLAVHWHKQAKTLDSGVEEMKRIAKNWRTEAHSYKEMCKRYEKQSNLLGLVIRWPND